MAKKEQKEAVDTLSAEQVIHPRKKKKKSRKLAIFFLIVVILGGLGWFFRTPIQKFLGNVTKDIPFLNSFFSVAQEEVAYTYDELMSQVESLRRELESANSKVQEQEDQIVGLTSRNSALMQYEENQLAFMEEKNQWDAARARENPTLFIETYEKMYADNRNDVYEVLKAEQVLTKQQKEHAKVVSEMDEEQAAEALTILVATDPNLVVTILNGMQVERKAAILSAMDASIAATVIKLLSPA